MLQWMNAAYIWAQIRFEGLLKNEKGEVNVVAIVVLIGIAVLLAILFRKQITNVLNGLFKTIGDEVTSALADS